MVFDTWVQNHGPGLLNYLKSMMSQTADAEDIWQETFMRVHQSMDRYQDQGQEKAWIYRIAKNRLIDHARSQTKKPFIVPIEDKHAIEKDEPLDQLISGEKQHLFESAIQALPEAQKEVYLMRQRSDLTFKEIAEVLDLPMQKVVGRMNLAMKKLKDVLGRIES